MKKTTRNIIIGINLFIIISLMAIILIIWLILQTNCGLAEIIRYETPLAYIPGLVPVDKASDEKDAEARALIPTDGKCLVYFINDAPTWFVHGIDCYVNKELIGRISSKNYIYTFVSPGKHSFVTTSFFEKEKRRGTLELQFIEGQTYYLEQVFDNIGRVNYKKFQLIKLPDDIGKEKMKEVFLSKQNWKEENVPNLKKLDE